MKTISALAGFLVLLVGAVYADDYLPVEDQLEIISAYAFATGQVMSTLSTSELGMGEGELPLKCGTPAVLQFLYSYDRLDPALLKSLGVKLSERPLGLDDTVASPSNRFLIHYTTVGTDAVWHATDTNANGVPVYVDSMVAMLEYVYSYMMDTLGFSGPPHDFLPDGDGRYDVYIRNLPVVYYGLTRPDTVLNGPHGTYLAATFMEMRNDYTPLPYYHDRPYDAMRVTCAHEFFHAVQFGIDYTEYGEPVEKSSVIRPYWEEMSAVWMEEQIYDTVNDYYYYLPSFFSRSAASLEQFLNSLDLHPYASVVFPIYLSSRFGRDVIKDIWIRCGELGAGPSFLTAADQIIDSASSGHDNLATIVGEFALACYFVNERARFLPFDIHRHRFWRCNDGAFPNCQDSSVVTDTIGVDIRHVVDTVVFRGFEEAAMYPDWYYQVWDDDQREFVPVEVIHRYTDYPVYVLQNNNPDHPEHNGLHYIEFLNWQHALPIDTIYWKCTTGVYPDCEDSVRVRDTTQGYDFYHIDSSFTVYFGLGDNVTADQGGYTLNRGWVVNIALQDAVDSSHFEVENYYLADDNLLPNHQIPPMVIPKARKYLSGRVTLSPSSTDEEIYRRTSSRAQKLGYLVGDPTTVDSTRRFLPGEMLSPYPNPAVVGEMDQQSIVVGFQVPTDAQAQPVYRTPYLTVDVYSLAGERVATVGQSSRLLPYGGRFFAEWNMKNEAGKEVASGVYIAHGRMYTAEKKGILLADDRKKVAVIR